MDDKDKAKAEFWKVHSYISDYIRLADTKAGAIIAWCGGLIGILLASQTHHLFTETSFSLTSMEWHTTGMAIVSLLAFILLGAGIVAAFMCIKPRLWSQEGMKEHPKGYVYWEDVKAHGSADNFKKELGTVGVGGFGDMCAEHTFVLSVIASKKFWWVDRSLWIAFAGSVAAAIARLCI